MMKIVFFGVLKWLKLITTLRFVQILFLKCNSINGFHNMLCFRFHSLKLQLSFLHVWLPAPELFRSMRTVRQVYFAYLLHVPHIFYLVSIAGILL